MDSYAPPPGEGFLDLGSGVGLVVANMIGAGVFLSAGFMAQLAHTTGLNRETLYRTLSKNGNPRLSSLGLIIEALGLRLSIESPEGDPRAA